jgi:Putative restriction endonuclease
MSEGTILTPVTDRSGFFMHPEDWVSQQDSHDEQCAYFKQALRLLLQDCFVARDLAVYWVPGQMQHPYVGPDIFIARQQPKVEDPRAWLTYEDGLLGLVIEVASDATRAKEEAKRNEVYAAALQVPEYAYFDLLRDEWRLGRLVAGGYVWVDPDEQGRLWSREFGFGFAWLKGERLARVVAPDGAIVPTAQEMEALRQAESAQRREAEARAEREARRAEREARRAEWEAEQRTVAEQRNRELAAELERFGGFAKSVPPPPFPALHPY